MKILHNKVTGILRNEKEFATYADLLITLMNKPVQKMIPLKELKRDLDIIDTLEKSKETVELTDAEYTHLSNLVENSEWAIRHKDIVTFSIDFESLGVTTIDTE